MNSAGDWISTSPAPDPASPTPAVRIGKRGPVPKQPGEQLRSLKIELYNRFKAIGERLGRTKKNNDALIYLMDIEEQRTSSPVAFTLERKEECVEAANTESTANCHTDPTPPISLVRQVPQSSVEPKEIPMYTRAAAAAAASALASASAVATSEVSEEKDSAWIVQRLRKLTPDQQVALVAGSSELQEALRRALSPWEDDQRRMVQESSQGLRPTCTCRRCYHEASEGESTCCGRDIENCITLDPIFVQFVINRDHLLLSMWQRNALWATRDDGSTSEQFRHHAYRNFIYWFIPRRHGHQRRGNRIPVYSCVFKVIRRAYPDPNGVYKHFQDADDMVDYLRFL